MSLKSNTSGDPSGNVHFLALDGVRGLAVTLVFLFHASIYWTMDLWTRLGILGYVANRGLIGVDIFFVLSGFLITGILLKAKAARNYYSSFYARRAFRIFPLYYAAVAIFFLLSAFRHDVYPAKIQIFYWLNLSSWYSAFRPDPIFLTHFWTLANEEQFYFVWPLLVRRLSHRVLIAVCAIMLPLQYVLRMAPQSQMMNHFHHEMLHRLPVFHSEGLFLGSLLAILFFERRVNVKHLPYLRVLTVVSLVLTWASMTVRFSNVLWIVRLQYTLLAIASASGIALLVASPSGGLSWLFQRRGLRILGRYSFCIYIIHIPVILTLHHHLSRYVAFRDSSLVGLVTLFLIYGFTVLIAAISWRYFEEPILALKRHFMYRVD